MRSLPPLALVGALLALAGPAGAASEPPRTELGHMTGGYTYYSRPGASLEQHDADVRACVAEARRIASFNGPRLSSQQAPGAIGYGFMYYNGEDDPKLKAWHGAVGAAIENCMVVRGWQVMQLAKPEGQALAALAPQALTESLRPWIAAEAPHGVLVRTWRNDAADARNERWTDRNEARGAVILSVSAATGQVFNLLTPDGDGAGAVWTPQGGTLPILPPLLTPNGVATAPADRAVLVIYLYNFTWNGPDLTLAGGGDDARITLRPAQFPKARPTPVAFAVRPGRWRLSAIGGLSFCLGAPAVDVKAGEVVYLGAFDMGGRQLGPDLGLDRARAWLGPAAERVRAADYINGVAGSCAGAAGVYALEAPGRPFVDGYRWGGAAR